MYIFDQWQSVWLRRNSQRLFNRFPYFGAAASRAVKSSFLISRISAIASTTRSVLLQAATASVLVCIRPITSATKDDCLWRNRGNHWMQCLLTVTQRLHTVTHTHSFFNLLCECNSASALTQTHKIFEKEKFPSRLHLVSYATTHYVT